MTPMHSNKRLRVLIAPDSFKGSLRADEAARCMARGLARVFPEAEADLLPVADGGEGTAENMASATSGSLVPHPARDALGRPLTAAFALCGDGRTAVVDAASASGLTLLAPHERNPLIAGSRGTGELMAAALMALRQSGAPGKKRLILGLGGSACNDGGAGALRALGLRLLDERGRELEEGGAALAGIAAVDASGLDPLLAETELILACDVNNPLLGEKGASAVFGPQKGASPDMVATLDAALGRYAEVARKATGRDAASLPGAGAAGGLAAGFLYFTGASVRSGVEMVLEAVNFAERAAGADLVLTGEGRADGQTSGGKAPLGVARAAKAAGKPVICIAGALERGAGALYDYGVDAMSACVVSLEKPERVLLDAADSLEAATERVLRTVRLGMRLGLR